MIPFQCSSFHVSLPHNTQRNYKKKSCHFEWPNKFLQLIFLPLTFCFTFCRLEKYLAADQPPEKQEVSLDIPCTYLWPENPLIDKSDKFWTCDGSEVNKNEHDESDDFRNLTSFHTSKKYRCNLSKIVSD